MCCVCTEWQAAALGVAAVWPYESPRVLSRPGKEYSRGFGVGTKFCLKYTVMDIYIRFRACNPISIVC